MFRKKWRRGRKKFVRSSPSSCMSKTAWCNFQKTCFPLLFLKKWNFLLFVQTKIEKKIPFANEIEYDLKIWCDHLKADMLIEAWIMSHVWSIKIFLCLDIRNFRRQLFQMGFEYKWCHMMLKTKSGNHRQKVMVMFLMHGRVVHGFL